MRRFYILVGVLFIACVLIFISSFFYLDKTKHNTYYYTINLDNHDFGFIKIEKFETEDKLIYRSTTTLPFSPLFTQTKSRLVLDRKYNIESYSKQWSGNGQTALIYMENDRNLISFVSRFDSEFVAMENIPIRKDTFVFEEDSLETYIPIIENYDFRSGGPQGFNALTCFSCALPPMNRFVTLTSVRSEYMKIGLPPPFGLLNNRPRKVRAENLLLKIRNYPQRNIWVSKADRTILKIVLPNKSLTITRALRPERFESKEYAAPTDDTYSRENVTFKNKDIMLAGTLSMPKKEGRLPAVLLVWGSGPQDRQYQGLFTSIADYLARNGYAVLQFDKRGVGASEGDLPSSTDNDIVQDVTAALEYLSKRQDIDPKNLFMIGHSEGAFYSCKASSAKNIAKGLILMAPAAYPQPEDIKTTETLLKNTVSKYRWSEDYLKLTLRLMQETVSRVKNSTHNWASILRKRCFLKNIRDRLSENPNDVIKKTAVPVLTLQGKEDETASLEFAPLFDNLLSEGGNGSHAIIYYPDLGHFLGKPINDGIHKIYYQADKKVLEDIKTWLDGRIHESSHDEQKELT